MAKLPIFYTGENACKTVCSVYGQGNCNQLKREEYWHLLQKTTELYVCILDA